MPFNPSSSNSKISSQPSRFQFGAVALVVLLSGFTVNKALAEVQTAVEAPLKSTVQVNVNVEPAKVEVDTAKAATESPAEGKSEASKADSSADVAGKSSDAANGSAAVPDSLFNRLPLTELKEKGKDGTAKSLSKYASNTAASLANFILDARGFDFSMEGADLVLGQHGEKALKGDSAKEYLTRAHYDKKELAVTQSIMQIASLMDKDMEQTQKARADLRALIGEESEQKVYDELANMPMEELPAEREKASWGLADRKEKLTAILEKSAAQDGVLTKVTERLAKYNHRSKTMQIVAKVMYTGCGIASFAPTLAAPIAETTMMAFMYATGGPEQDKLLKELYLSKMMQSRCDLTNEKAHLMLESRDLALLSNNKRLYTWSKNLLGSMTGSDIAEQMYSGKFVTADSGKNNDAANGAAVSGATASGTAGATASGTASASTSVTEVSTGSSSDAKKDAGGSMTAESSSSTLH